MRNRNRIVALFVALLCLFALAAPGWALTNAQLDTVKAEIVADAALSALMAQGAEWALAEELNKSAVPEWVVWKSAVTAMEWRAALLASGGAAQLNNLTASNRESLLWAISDTIDPSNSVTRAALDDFCGAQNTLKAALLSAQKRASTRVEKVLSTGTGTTASPAVLGFEGAISPADVGLAIRRP